MLGRALICGWLAACAVAAPASAADLTAGAGRADITPPTGYYAMGWVRSDAVLEGQHTRLFARALVLERDGRKVALVAMDLGAIPGGLVKHAADLLADRGFSERNVLVSASHTHAAPTGLYNFTTYNTVFMTTGTPSEQNVAGELDPQLYAFMVRRLAEAIRRADDDRAPAAAAWGRTRISGVTRNRSFEAHLANHGVMKEFGEGKIEDDPQGYEETINPDVDVLRVDKVRRRKRRIPIGMWSTFANHGTVNPHTFTVYNADHHGSATRVSERAVRRRGKVRASQEVVTAFGNTDEGDMSSGLDRRGPAWADEVGRIEADAFVRAWRDAGKRLSRAPALDSRWTRVCFCGQEVEGGAVDSSAVTGLPLFTGSEEGRGPLYDHTQTPFEGRTSPVDAGPQGNKMRVSSDDGANTPKAIPLMAVRVGDRMIGSIPGEMTVGMGRRVREAMEARAGIPAVLSGLANEYLSYFVSPEEYDRQHYEGGSTMYGRVSSNLIKGGLVDLAGRLVGGEPAPEPYAFDPTHGVSPDAPAFEPGADSGSALEQPEPVRRLEQATFAWQGGPRGLDRPLDAPFVRIERRVRRAWVPYTDDLGLQVLWRVDEGGRHDAVWEVAHSAPAGTYRFVVTANRYRVESASFSVEPTRRLDLVRLPDTGDGRIRVRMLYPVAAPDRDLTYRPQFVRGGRVTFKINRRIKVVRRIKGTQWSISAPPDASVTIAAGGARDRFNNVNAAAMPAGPVD